MNTEIKLFENKSDCCGCGACYNECPQDAISLNKDEYGFLFPRIDTNRCIKCGLCGKVCPIKNENNLYRSTCAYAVALKDTKILKKSASGGAFAGIAHYILEQGGIVYGASYGKDLYVHHIDVKNKKDLEKLQDSKYVQSDTERTYTKVRENLADGKKVLFCGTPCQIAGLKSFLHKDYEKLYTLDLVCHGVPSYQFFIDGINSLVKIGDKIKQVSFRSKENGWGTEGFVLTENGKYLFNERTSSYYYYFLRSATYRDSCYKCKFASENRPGDISIGDYWKIESAHPDFRKIFDETKGVSCVLINTEKGKELFDFAKKEFYVIDSSVQLVKERNGRLSEEQSRPAPSVRKTLLEIYKNEGYPSINKYWMKNERKQLYILRIKDLVRPFYKIIKRWLREF